MSVKIRPEFKDLTDDEREAVMAWVRGHGLEPADVPENGISFDNGGYTIEVYERNANGLKYVDQLGGVVRRLERRPAEPRLPWPTRAMPDVTE